MSESGSPNIIINIVNRNDDSIIRIYPSNIDEIYRVMVHVVWAKKRILANRCQREEIIYRMIEKISKETPPIPFEVSMNKTQKNK